MSDANASTTTSMKGRVAVVTGASRGIGEAIARRFASEGAAVAVVARTQSQTDSRLPGTIHETVEHITAAGGRAMAVAADLSRPEDRAAIVPAVEAELGPVDVLVNNAAVTFFAPVIDMAEKRYRLMFEVQVRAPFELSQAVLPGMRERGAGWILNISSVAARHPSGPPFGAMEEFGGTVYGMCKAALERFSTGLAAEENRYGVVVNSLAPTLGVVTPGVLLHGLVPEGGTGFDEPVEVMAEAALALCTSGPDGLTGRIAYSQPLLDELGRQPGPLDAV